MAAAKAHVAVHDQTQKRCSDAATKQRPNALFTEEIGWQNVQNRYKRFQTDFDKKDNKETLASGIGDSDLSEMGLLLSEMK